MEYKYPIYKEFELTGEIVKFTSLNSGTVMVSGNSAFSDEVGSKYDSRTDHTRKDVWKDTDFREPSKFNYYIRKEDV